MNLNLNVVQVHAFLFLPVFQADTQQETEYLLPAMLEAAPQSEQ